MNAEQIRESQRISRSCLECGRRKIKCDRKVPCAPCVRRNLAHECRRPITRVRGQLTVSVEEGDAEPVADLLKERSALKAQIAQLEIALTFSKPNSTQSSSTIGDVESNLEDLVPALEQFDLNIQADAQHGTLSQADAIRRLWDPASDPLYLLLPTRAASLCIVRYSLQTLGWIHCAVKSELFLLEHEQFWNELESGHVIEMDKRAWAGLYFSILAVGMLYIDLDQMPSFGELPQIIGHTSTDLIESAVAVARMWYEASLKQLEEAKFTRVVSLHALQALLVSTLCHANFGEHQQDTMLSGLAMNLARSLDMHKLGTEESFSPELGRRQEWATASGRHLGRRMWSTIIICDWLGSWSRPTSISPASFCCQISGQELLDFEVLPASAMPIEDTSLSPVQYLATMRKLAYVFYIYIRSNSHHNAAKLEKAMEEINTIRRSLPLHLTHAFPANEDDELWESMHPWIPFQRYLIATIIEFMQLSIARILAIAGSANEHARYKTLARTSASKILQSYVRVDIPRVYRLLWIVSASTVAAGVYIALDQLMEIQSTDTYIGGNLELIRQASSLLQQNAAVAIHGVKGSSVLNRLLLLLQKQPAGVSVPFESLTSLLASLDHEEYRHSKNTHQDNSVVSFPNLEYRDTYNTEVHLADSLINEEELFDFLNQYEASNFADVDFTMG